jgi:hypothetical protein
LKREHLRYAMINVMASKRPSVGTPGAFDAQAFLDSAGVSRQVVRFASSAIVFAQGPRGVSMPSVVTLAPARDCAQQHRPGSCHGVTLPEVGKAIIMPSTLLIVLIILWLVGVGTSFTLGGLIHLLLVIAIAVVLLRVIQGRNPLQG